EPPDAAARRLDPRVVATLDGQQRGQLADEQRFGNTVAEWRRDQQQQRDPGPTEPTSPSKPNGPPDTVKNMTATSGPKRRADGRPVTGACDRALRPRTRSDHRSRKP